MVKIVTKLDAYAVKSLNKFAFKKTLPLLIVLSALIAVFGLCNLPDVDGDYFLGIFLIACGVLFIPLCLLFTTIGQKKSAKSMPILAVEPISTFTFYDDRYSLEEEKGETYHRTVDAVYDYFNKVYETKTHYFLYISQTQCHVLAKKDIVEGSVEELNLLLFRNLGPKKFIPQKKR